MKKIFALLFIASFFTVAQVMAATNIDTDYDTDDEVWIRVAKIGKKNEQFEPAKAAFPAGSIGAMLENTGKSAMNGTAAANQDKPKTNQPFLPIVKNPQSGPEYLTKPKHMTLAEFYENHWRKELRRTNLLLKYLSQNPNTSPARIEELVNQKIEFEAALGLAKENKLAKKEKKTQKESVIPNLSAMQKMISQRDAEIAEKMEQNCRTGILCPDEYGVFSKPCRPLPPRCYPNPEAMLGAFANKPSPRCAEVYVIREDIPPCPICR